MCIVICTLLLSRPARGAWVEIRRFWAAQRIAPSRAPQGARGLKYYHRHRSAVWRRRAPQGARGLKLHLDKTAQLVRRRAPQGARGLKYDERAEAEEVLGRAPQGARGLKYEVDRANLVVLEKSRPARGAWVEIISLAQRAVPLPCRAPQGARGLKSWLTYELTTGSWSRPARGAWVEIPFCALKNAPSSVAPRKGRVG